MHNTASLFLYDYTHIFYLQLITNYTLNNELHYATLASD